MDKENEKITEALMRYKKRRLKAAADKAAADKAEADRLKAAADKAAADKAEADKAEADKAAADKAEADKAEADRLKAAADKAAADKAAADKEAADNAAADKATADKEAAVRLKAEAEASRLKAEAEASRLKAEAAARLEEAATATQEREECYKKKATADKAAVEKAAADKATADKAAADKAEDIEKRLRNKIKEEQEEKNRADEAIKLQELYGNFYTTIYNSGGEIGNNIPGYFDDNLGKKTYFVNHCILLSIMDHLLIKGDIKLDTTLLKFRDENKITFKNWSSTEEFNSYNQNQLNLFENICIKYNFTCMIIQAKLDEGIINWRAIPLLPIFTETGETTHEIYGKNIYILATGTHFELLINGPASDLYNEIPIYMYKNKTFMTNSNNNEIKRDYELYKKEYEAYKKEHPEDDRISDIMIYVLDLKKDYIDLVNQNKYLKYKQKYLQLKKLLKKQKKQ